MNHSNWNQTLHVYTVGKDSWKNSWKWDFTNKIIKLSLATSFKIDFTKNNSWNWVTSWNLQMHDYLLPLKLNSRKNVTFAWKLISRKKFVIHTRNAFSAIRLRFRIVPGVWIWLKFKELDAMKVIEYLFDDWFQFCKICNLKNKLKNVPIW